MFFSFHMDYSDGEVALPECHRVKRKDMKLFCFFLDVFIAGFRSATVVLQSCLTSTTGNRAEFVSTFDLNSCSFP